VAGVSAPARTLARERAMQFLFSLAFTNYPWDEILEDFWTDNPSRPTVRRYGDFIIKGVHKNINDIETMLIDSLKGWTPERVGKVEWAIMLVAAFEMRYAEDVPPKVAIDEAIELAKRYGSDEAPTFVNGVLDRVMHSAESAKTARA
jgi:N utilization substance protein B